MTDYINQISDDDDFLEHYLPGKSEAMVDLRCKISILNQNINRDLIRNVLITGESGSGKNWVSKVIAGHRQWLVERASSGLNELGTKLRVDYSRYEEINLPGLPDTLIENELFGYIKGAFTGADKDKKGYLEQGYEDILLDEIGDLSLPMQPKLLRVLNDGKFRPIGGGPEHEAETNSRLLMATNRDLFQMVRDGQFREDLLWRLRQFVITVPPLREQSDNVHAIAINIVREVIGTRNAIKPEEEGDLPSLSSIDIDFSQTYTWPGNVRQLSHAILRWLVYHGQKSLKDYALEIESELVQPGLTQNSLRDRVFELLDDAVAHNKPAADSVKDFFDTNFTMPVQQAMVEYIDQRSPRPSTLEAIFPGTKDANSVRSTIRKWRKK
jgi:transcriptional regulator with GAF, ATPase, and Fis domain